ncbi:response regulator [Pseudanabaena sp. FACHB-2040]|uniref:response regulator n=1 Tax=Pseudanabaena sp. FACHB-2040 TaxID=2692859 RepID=UPI0016863B4F|nr:response regulator [Pseudanabaena sp. FACHB-2040]MBD2260809.1 response regulator [Pseudanabaena sp. FACHB-2040]
METAAERLILVIDHHPEHVRVIDQALSETAGQYRLVAIAEVAQALSFLNRQGAYTDAPRPDLILLDLDLPEKNGWEILTAIKAAPHLRRIPIVVLTLADSEADVFDSYAMQGNCYVIKSADLNQLYHLVKRIEDFWLGIVTLPLE